MTIALATATAAMFAAAATQALGGAPGFGTLQFHGEALSLPARAGGAASLDALGCAGYATLQPTAAIEVSAAGPLFIAAGADQDLTLAVRGPDGSVLCADDEAGGLNPGAAYDRAEPGLYEVWVGTFGAAEGYPAITVNVAADGFDTTNPYIITPDPARRADQTLRLSGRFNRDPRALDVTAGGEASMSMLDGLCSGVAGEAPAVVLTYGGGDLPLYLLLESEADATLAVVTPSGEVRCADDTIGADPGVLIDTPEPGRYAVFAGLYDATGRTAPATLSISEIGFGGVDRRLDVAGEPVFGRVSLSGGFTPDPATYDLRAGGPVDLTLSLGEEAGACAGYATRAPSLRLTYDGRGPLFISTLSAEDTTLAVNTPDGRWTCDDDSLGNLDPMVSFDPAQPGVYDIYTGVFFQGESAPATLYVSELAPGAGPAARIMDVTLEADRSVALQPGFARAEGTIPVRAGGMAEPGAIGETSCPGLYSGQPSVELNWAGGALALFTEGDADTTLAVAQPDGRWICDDDGGEGLLSRIALDGAPGLYAIFVGTFGGEPADTVLRLEEAHD